MACEFDDCGTSCKKDIGWIMTMRANNDAMSEWAFWFFGAMRQRFTAYTLHPPLMRPVDWRGSCHVLSSCDFCDICMNLLALSLV